MSKQSSIEWLIKELKDLSFTSTFAEVYYTYNLEKLCEQAKAMHKEEMKEMYLKGIKNYDPKFGGDNE